MPATPFLPDPPRPDRRTVVRDRHGDRFEDHYAWMADAEDPALVPHLEAENRYVEAFLEPLGELQATIFDEIRSHVRETDLSVPVRKGEWSWYVRTEEGLDYPIHCRRRVAADGTEGPEEVYFDENAEAGDDDFFDLGAFEVDPAHRLLLWSVDRSGDETYDLHVRDLETGEDRALGPVGVAGGGTWATDGSVLFLRLDDTKRPHQVWCLGPDGDEHLVLEEPDGSFHLGVGRERDDEVLVISAGSHDTTEVWILPADRPRAEPMSVGGRRPGVEYWLSHHRGRLLVVTNLDAPEFRVVETPADAPDLDAATDLIAPEPGTLVRDLDVFDDFGVLFVRRGGVVRAEVLDWGTGIRRPLAVPEALSTVWAGANPESAASAYRFGFTSMVTPPSVWLDHLDGEPPELLKEQEVPGYDRERYRTERRWYPSADGTQVPASLVWRDDTGEGAPALLTVYGAYEVPLDPYFSPARLSLLDRGFVVALAHPRGGGELGRDWYEQAKFATKHRTFDDTVAVARGLLAGGLVRADGLVVRGGSAGGLTVGAAVNAAPDAFAGVVAEVPFVDALTTMLDDSLPLTRIEWSEWGNPEADPEIFAAMRAYAPYDNVAGRPYPPIYATAGLSDPRVGYWEPAKWVARLRDLAPDGGPYLLRTELGAGHGGPTGRYDAWRDEARVLSFVLWAVGHPDAVTPT